MARNNFEYDYEWDWSKKRTVVVASDTAVVNNINQTANNNNHPKAINPAPFMKPPPRDVSA